MLPRSLLLIGCFALCAQEAAWAEPYQELSKPLNLVGFSKAAQAKNSRNGVKPAAAKSVTAIPRPVAAIAGPADLLDSASPDLPLTTAAIPEPAAPATKKAAQPASGGDAAVADRRGLDAADFCKNITDAALDARVAWQQKQLEASEAKLRERIAELESKRAEYEKWLKLRDDFLKKAEESVVEIYSRMEPDAAALQIANMGDEAAAAVLAKLRVRNASAILNEMEPRRAAQLADTLSGMRRPDDGKTSK